MLGLRELRSPGGPARLEEIDRADIVKVAARKPAANFPASIAIARIQAEDYESYTSDGVGMGNFRVLTTQELATERQFQHISELPSVRGVAPINRLLLTSPLKSVDDLRLAAANVQADVLLIYTIDTTFRIEGRAYGPLSVISLGLIPNRDAHITSTASAIFKDVRTGFVYGLAESTAKASGLANVWNTRRTIDRKRVEAERKAFKRLIPEISKTWTGIARQYAAKTKP
ncbi:MAG: hypothetical protein ACREVE_12410 [Gammaproteobacteria bacterium]